MKRIATLIAGALLLGATPPPPTYHQDVMPILAANCLGCHTAGGIGPFPLDDPQWAQKMAPVVVQAIQSGRMPPWPPGGETPALVGERRVSSEQLAVVAAWAQAGAPLGKAPYKYVPIPSLNPVAERPGLRPAQPYTPDARLYDDYRCFLVEPRFASDTFITGYRIHPEQTSLVHHVLLFNVGPEFLGVAQNKNGLDGRPGWPCFGGPNLGGTPNALGNLLGFWVPGTSGTDFPAGTGVLMKAGSFVVAQMHYNMGSSPPKPDQTSFELKTAPVGSNLKPVRTMALAAPVEVRCPPGQSGPQCERQYALQRSELPLIANGIHNTCKTSVEDYLRQPLGDGSRQTTSCSSSIGQPRTVLGATLHMHLRGTEIRIDLNPGTSRARTLLHIPRWDFQWQGQYWYREPIELVRGDRVQITCTYDNSTSLPGPGGEPLVPRYMTWGEGTTDEMCLGALSFVY